MFNKKPVIPDYRSGVLSELEKESLDIDDVVEILKVGFDCTRSKRKEAVIEKCHQRRDRIIKVVVLETNDYWLLRHVGSFKLSRKKIRRRYGKYDK